MFNYKIKDSIILISYNSVQSGLHNITLRVKETLEKELQLTGSCSGILHLFCPHTSCALAINESWDPSAKSDLEKFFDHLAPRNLPFIEHTLEGPDDSPAHMKSALLNQHLTLFVDQKQLVLGQWQGIFLAEFREKGSQRKIFLKYQPD